MWFLITLVSSACVVCFALWGWVYYRSRQEKVKEEPRHGVGEDQQPLRKPKKDRKGKGRADPLPRPKSASGVPLLFVSMFFLRLVF